MVADEEASNELWAEARFEEVAMLCADDAIVLAVAGAPAIELTKGLEELPWVADNCWVLALNPVKERVGADTIGVIRAVLPPELDVETDVADETIGCELDWAVYIVFV
jgi:hypothetical protein